MRKLLIMAAVASALAGGGAQAAEKNGGMAPGDAAVIQQVSAAGKEFQLQEFDHVVDVLGPTMKPGVFDRLSAGMQYGVLGLYARSQYALGSWDEAHEAFISLTANRNATREDWTYRLDTARKVGDRDDAALAAERLETEEDDGPPVAG